MGGRLLSFQEGKAIISLNEGNQFITASEIWVAVGDQDNQDWMMIGGSNLVQEKS